MNLLRHRRDKGDWAELVFMAKALTLGFTVCRPYGDNHRFDFLLFAPGGPARRIQVKSSWVKTDNMYRVVYVVPEDAWYVIPRRKLARYDVGYVMPHIPHSHAQWERYRDRWDLLRRPTRSSSRTKQRCRARDPAA